MRVAVTSRSFSRHPTLRAELLARFEAVTFNDAGATLSGAALVAFLRGHDRAITALEKIDDAVLAQLPELKVISKYGVGLDTLDLDAMTRRGVQLGWTAGVNCRSVAELALAFIISALHRVPEATALVRSGGWQQIAGRQLTGRTVGIVGCGHVGQDLVRLLAPFGCTVIAFDQRDYAFFAAHGVQRVSLSELLSSSDVVTVHLPFDETTRGLIDARALAAVKPGAILVNSARGGIVDESALLAALDDGRLAGAALDVLASEPPDDPRLIQHPRVLVTPHIGGSTEEAVLAMGRAAISGLDRFAAPSTVVATAVVGGGAA